ncbi:MAG: hypothetical protein HY271_06985 [Deltaproteobacteria bacterium]|nr:hypothetical protein [Deltaproteobacteria bacterium]
MPTSAPVSLERYVREVERWVQALACDIEAPALDATGRFTHQTQDVRVAAFLKAVRLASTLNAAVILLRVGHVLEVGALCRMIDEACEDIAFLQIPTDANGPRGPKQNAAQNRPQGAGCLPPDGIGRAIRRLLNP